MTTKQNRSNDDVLRHLACDSQDEIVEKFTFPAENLDDGSVDVVNFVKDRECANAPALALDKFRTSPGWFYVRLRQVKQRKARTERLGRMAALRRLAAQQRARTKSDQIAKSTARRSSRAPRSQPVRTVRRDGGRKAAAQGGGSGGGSGDGGRLARRFAARLINTGAAVMGGQA